MSALLDINVLLALADGQHGDHIKACEWLETISGDRQVGLCRIVQMGFLRLLNNPSVMGPAVRIGSAVWGVWDKILQDDRFFWVDEPIGLEDAFRRLSRSFAASPKRWPDAYLAAFAEAASLDLVTFDSGFRAFEGFHFRLLSDSSR